MSNGFMLLSEHVANPRHVGNLATTSGRAIYMDEQRGFGLRIALHVERGRILDARSRTLGDATLRGIASFVLECAIGQEMHHVAGIDAADVVRTLEIPPEQTELVQIVLLTLLEALQDVRQRCGCGTGGGRS